MGINRWSGGIEERKRNETDAKAGDEVPKKVKGDRKSTRLNSFPAGVSRAPPASRTTTAVMGPYCRP